MITVPGSSACTACFAREQHVGDGLRARQAADVRREDAIGAARTSVRFERNVLLLLWSPRQPALELGVRIAAVLRVDLLDASG